MEFQEPVEEITRAVNALLALPEASVRGSVIPWHVLEAAAGPRTELRCRYIVTKFRKRLLRDRQINTRFAIDVGLRLLTDAEAAVEMPQMRWKRTFRQLGRGLREMAAVSLENLTDHGRRLLIAQQEAMQAERRNVFAAKQNLVRRRLPVTVSDDPRRATR